MMGKNQNIKNLNHLKIGLIQIRQANIESSETFYVIFTLRG